MTKIGRRLARGVSGARRQAVLQAGQVLVMRWVRKRTFRLLALALCAGSFASLPVSMTGGCLDLLSGFPQPQPDGRDIVNRNACHCPMCRSGTTGESCACCRHDGKCSCSMSSTHDESGRVFYLDAAVLRKKESFSVLLPFVHRAHVASCPTSITDLTVPTPPPKAQPEA